MASEELKQAAEANTPENFRYVFEKALEGFFIDRMEQNEELFARYMNDKGFRKIVEDSLTKDVYERFQSGGQP